MTNPAEDPILTVRVHPDFDPADPRALRRVKVDGSDHAGPYVGAHWDRLTFNSKGVHKDDGCDPVTDEDVAGWPVQSLAEVARILGHPAPDAALRDELRAWADGIIRAPGMVAPADVRRAVLDILKRHAALVPVEDTDTPCTCEVYDTSGGLVTHYGSDPDCPQHPAEPHPADQSTVDSETEEFFRSVHGQVRALVHKMLGHKGLKAQHCRPCDEDATKILAALPELDENEGLRSDVRRAEEAFEAERKHRLQLETDLGIARGAAKQYRQHWERARDANTRLLDDPKTATAAANAELRAKFAERNRAYGRASATIGQLRGDNARLKGYRHSVREFIADARKFDAELTERNLEGQNIFTAYDKLTAEVERLKQRIADDGNTSTPDDVITDWEAAARRPVPQCPHHGARVEVTGNGSTRLGYVSGLHKINHGETKSASWIVIVVCDDNAVLAAPLDQVKVVVP